jgi:DNA-directed RNA polymerase subunit RPC12/RpoP
MNNYPECPECSGKIHLGVAIVPEWEGGRTSCFFTPLKITHKNLELIPVYKCMVCGYSCNNEYDLIWSEE